MSTSFCVLANDKAYIGTRNWVDSPQTEIVASNENVGNPATNVATRSSYNVWRIENITAGNEVVTLDIDLKEDRPIDFLGLTTPRVSRLILGDFYLSLSDTDTIEWRLDADGGTPGAGAVQTLAAQPSAIEAGYGVHRRIFDTTQIARYVQLIITATSRILVGTPPDTEKGYADISRVMVCELFRPEYQFVFGHNIRWNSSTVITRSARARSDGADIGAHYRELSMEFRGISDVEVSQWEMFDRIVSTGEQFVFGLSDDETKPATDVMLCRQSQQSGIQSVGPDFWRKPVRLIESL